MAFPTVGHSGAAASAQGTSHSFDYSTITGADPSNGDLIIVAFSKDDDVEPSAKPTGFTELESIESADNMWLWVGVKKSDGTETAAAFTTDSEEAAAAIYIIDADSWSGTITDVEAGTTRVVNGNLWVGGDISSAVTASWGADDNLLVGIGGWDSNSVVSTWQTDWPDNRETAGGTANGAAGIAIASVETTTDGSSIPGWIASLDDAEQIAGLCLAVKPAAAAAVTGSFTADAIIEKAQTGSFTADALIITGADLGYDYFGRSISNLDNDTSDSGHTWDAGPASEPGPPSPWTGTGDGEIVAYFDDGNDYTDSTTILEHTATQDTRVLTRCRFPEDPSGLGTDRYDIVLNARGLTSDGYRVMTQFQFNGDGTIDISFRGRDNGGWVTPWGAVYDVASWTDMTTDEFYVEMITYGTSPTYIDARVWLVGGSRPSSAQATTTTSNSDWQRSGQTGFWMFMADTLDHYGYVSEFEAWSHGFGSFTADAYFAEGGVTGSFTADAVLQKAQTGSFTADAVIAATQAGSFTSDAIVFATQTGAFTLQAIKYDDVPGADGAFSTDAVIKAAATGDFTADAVTLASYTGTLTADAVILWTASESFTAAGWLAGTFSVDAFIGAEAATGDFTADAILLSPRSATVLADAVVERTAEAAFSTDAILSHLVQAGYSLDAVVLKQAAAAISVDAVVLATTSASFTGDATVLATAEATFAVDASLKYVATDSFGADAAIGLVGQCVWVSPADTSQIQNDPVLVFTMPQTTSGDMHFQIELDTDSGFSAPTVVQSPGTGWEYWDGDSWEPIPSSGVPAAMVGNDARYTVQTPLTNGTWYRRVRAGVI